MTEAAKRLPDAELRHERAKQESAEAESAAVMVARLRSELEGLDSLRPEAAPGLRRLCDVLTPEAGYEAAFSAVPGPLLDALVARGEGAAESTKPAGQLTLLFPTPSPEPRSRAPFGHVRPPPRYQG